MKTAIIALSFLASAAMANPATKTATTPTTTTHTTATAPKTATATKTMTETEAKEECTKEHATNMETCIAEKTGHKAAH
jgi:hypothetical protein